MSPRPAQEGKYKIGTICRLTGFTAAALRAWEKRYALLEPGRGSGRQRLYSDEDLRILYRVRELLHQGHSIGEIAIIGRKALAEGTEKPLTSPTAPAIPRPPEHSTTSGDAAAPFEGYRADIVKAAAALDGDTIERTLDEAFAIVSTEQVISGVIEPAARTIGEEWAAGRCSVAGEHLASALFAKRLRGLLMRNIEGRGNRPAALCACFPTEQHEIGAMVVAYYLSRFGHHVVYLGAALPFDDLEVALETLQPNAVYLSVTRRVLLLTHKPRLLDLLRRWSATTVFLVGGRGVPPDEQEIIDAGGRLWPEARSVLELREVVGGKPESGRGLPKRLIDGAGSG